MRGYAHGARAGRRGDARAVGQAVRRGAIEAPTGRSLGFLIWTRRMKPSRARATPSRGVHPAFSGSVTGQIDSRKDQSSDPDFPLGGRPLRRALRSPRAVAQTAAGAPRERCRGCSRRSRVPRALSRVALRWRRSSLATSVRSIPRPRVATPTRRAGRSPGLGRRATRRTRSRTRRVSDRAAAPIAGSARPVGTTPTVSIRASARVQDPRARARASPLGTDDGSDPLLSNFLRRGIDPPGARTAPPNPAAPAPAWASSRWRGADGVGALHRPGHRRARDLNRRARGTQEHLPPPPRPASTPTAASGSRTASSPDLSTSPRDTRSSTSRSRSPHERAARWRDAPTKNAAPRSDPRSPPRDPTGPRRRRRPTRGRRDSREYPTRVLHARTQTRERRDRFSDGGCARGGGGGVPHPLDDAPSRDVAPSRVVPPGVRCRRRARRRRRSPRGDRRRRERRRARRVWFQSRVRRLDAPLATSRVSRV